MKRSNDIMRTGRRGVTLTELLVVLAIIGLLATIAVPTYFQKVELARIRTAQEETKRLAEAEEVVAIRHGFYVPLQVLDDNAEADPRNEDDVDDLYNTRREIDPLYLIDPSVPFEDQITTNQLRLQYSDRNDSDTLNRRVLELYEYWDGPFMNFQRVWTNIDYDINLVEALDDDDRARDYPLDPWNNPYRFYSPLGIIGTTADTTDPSNYDNDNFSNGELTRDGDYDFDRMAIVSYGPNGEEGDGNDVDDEDNDDIYYTFGRNTGRAAFRRF